MNVSARPKTLAVLKTRAVARPPQRFPILNTFLNALAMFWSAWERPEPLIPGSPPLATEVVECARALHPGRPCVSERTLPSRRTLTGERLALESVDMPTPEEGPYPDQLMSVCRHEPAYACIPPILG